jgi:hypothetical protein
VVSLRNIKAATTNPFRELNSLFSKIFEPAVKNRPFTEYAKTSNVYTVKLVLLPNQVLLVPGKVFELLTFSHPEKVEAGNTAAAK